MAKCPHCDANVTLENVVREVRGFAKKEVMYACPECRRILGFAFFFGGWLTGRP